MDSIFNMGWRLMRSESIAMAAFTNIWTHAKVGSVLGDVLECRLSSIVALIRPLWDPWITTKKLFVNSNATHGSALVPTRRCCAHSQINLDHRYNRKNKSRMYTHLTTPQKFVTFRFLPSAERRKGKGDDRRKGQRRIQPPVVCRYF